MLRKQVAALYLNLPTSSVKAREMDDGIAELPQSDKALFPDLPTNKLLSSAWLNRLDLAWFSKSSCPIVNSKPNQAVMDGLLDRLDRLDRSEHVTY
jgi:hypothetical protein